MFQPTQPSFRELNDADGGTRGNPAVEFGKNRLSEVRVDSDVGEGDVGEGTPSLPSYACIPEQLLSSSCNSCIPLCISVPCHSDQVAKVPSPVEWERHCLH